MPSILSGNSTPQMSNDPVSSVKNIINQIMSSANPQQTFNQVMGQSKEMQDAMNLIKQYGNGDPRQAFLNYMNQTGNQSIGQQIMQKLGLL